MARQNFVGLVISQGRMNKTVKVRVQGRVYDRRVDKEIVRRKDFLCHDEGNICKEGDFVRIEGIPKVSKRKAFAIAEIKVNKGQQFAEYEKLAKEKIIEEDRKEAQKFLDNKKQFQNIITQLQDLKRLDELSHKITSFEDVEGQESEYKSLVDEVNLIKAKYEIKSWPSVDPILESELTKPLYHTESEKRVYYMDHILNELMHNSKYSALKTEVLSKKFQDRPLDDVKKHIQKNVLRQFVLKEEKCPVPYPKEDFI
ncbi:hypothetical protein KGF56_003838 [Candida oxycetoniae]|uniref:Uncharacterized protein n=1 Tax=Candida oxycetoniae TaxID=497107 RepID=A0AAI9SV08_9ASCO|nr:uncharacterized protein KGF56_003838 [Candida oxycetoniae]KAI3403417.2 hypothetical protein KGF56_003838 [Candida oxycetoniae]